MIFEIKTAVNGRVLFVERSMYDAWKMYDLMLACGFKNAFLGNAAGYENCIVFVE